MTHSADIKSNNTIDHELDKVIIDFITNNILNLNRHQKYYAEQLIGSDAWQTLGVNMRIGIGKAVYRLVASGAFPSLTSAGRHSNNKQQYWLI